MRHLAQVRLGDRLRAASRAAARAALLATAAAIAGCNGFLEGDKIDDDPNAPSSATVNQLFVGVQATSIIANEGFVARLACIFVQQCAGTSNQHGGYGTYVLNEGDADGEFTAIWVAGGLIDQRAIQVRSIAVGDSVYAGIGMVLEALNIGNAAGLWGALPYFQAVDSTVATPALDPQLSVYTGVLAKLDTAIVYLAATGPTNVGPAPGDVDLVYGGDPAAWLRMAQTLKARYNLHLAELEGLPRYQIALEAALQGIDDPAGDYRTYHGTAGTENNIWFTFTRISRQGEVAIGARIVELMRARGDARLADYFEPIPATDPNDPARACPLAADPLPYGGAQPGDALDPCLVSDFANTRVAPEFQQPVVTYAENELILAESYFKLGDEGNARLHLDNVRVGQGGLPPSTASGPELLQQIGEEQYISLFQNVEAWATWKRTCVPALVPAAGAAEVYPRLLFGITERNSNPNIPPPGTPPNAGRNQNDPNPCPVPAG